MKESTRIILCFSEYKILESGCWEAPIVESGIRPRIVIHKRKMSLARFLCICEHGSPPEERYHAAHTCHNKWCVNPNHIEWQTPEQNAAEIIHHRSPNGGRAIGKINYEKSGKEYPMGIRYREGRGYLVLISKNGKRKYGGPYGTLAAALKWQEKQRQEWTP